MNGWLVDTSVFLRLADTASSEHLLAENAIAGLLSRNIPLFIAAQVLVEFWAVATRPERSNGLGWSPIIAAQTIRALRVQFPLLEDTPDALDTWLALVERCQVSGKHTHDARLASVMLTNNCQNLLTFNTSDFPPVWGINAVHPQHATTDDEVVGTAN